MLCTTYLAKKKLFFQQYILAVWRLTPRMFLFMFVRLFVFSKSERRSTLECVKCLKAFMNNKVYSMLIFKC